MSSSNGTERATFRAIREVLRKFHRPTSRQSNTRPSSQARPRRNHRRVHWADDSANDYISRKYQSPSGRNAAERRSTGRVFFRPEYIDGPLLGLHYGQLIFLTALVLAQRATRIDLGDQDKASFDALMDWQRLIVLKLQRYKREFDRLFMHKEIRHDFGTHPERHTWLIFEYVTSQTLPLLGMCDQERLVMLHLDRLYLWQPFSENLPPILKDRSRKWGPWTRWDYWELECAEEAQNQSLTN